MVATVHVKVLSAEHLAPVVTSAGLAAPFHTKEIYILLESANVVAVEAVKAIEAFVLVVNSTF